MKKFFGVYLCLVCLFFTGCYDMTDIENIKSIAVIGVSNNEITYCTVSTTPDEKIFDFDVYPVKTDNIYDGMNKVSLLTGKEASLSHLEAVVFNRDCTFERINLICSEIVRGVESHPKVLTAFCDVNLNDFFEGIKIPSDTSLYKIISDVLDDRFASSVKCTVKDLYDGIKYSKCATVPVIDLDEDGNMNPAGSLCINDSSIMYFDNNITRTINLLLDGKKPVFYPMSFGHVAVTLKEKKIRFSAFDKAEIKLHLIYNLADEDTKKEQEIERKIVSDTEKILDARNYGFDIINLKRELIKNA